MREHEISEQKKLTTLLFAKEDFDEYLLVEAKVQTFATYHISGKIVKEYFDDEESRKESFCQWKKVRNLCYDMVKGKKLPISFTIVLRLSSSMLLQWLKNQDIDNHLVDGKRFFVNIYYREKRLYVVSGMASETFGLDKSVEKLWDDEVFHILSQLKVIA